MLQKRKRGGRGRASLALPLQRCTSGKSSSHADGGDNVFKKEGHTMVDNILGVCEDIFPISIYDYYEMSVT